MKEKYFRLILGLVNLALYLTAAYSVLLIKNINVARITGIAVLSALVLLAIASLFVYMTKNPNYYRKTPAHFNHSLIAAFSIFLCCALIPEFNVLPQNQIFVNISFLLLTLVSICLDIYSFKSTHNKFTPYKLFSISQFILLIPLLCFPLSLHSNPYVIAFMTALLIATTIGEFLTVYKPTASSQEVNQRPVNQPTASSQEVNQRPGSQPRTFIAFSGKGYRLDDKRKTKFDPLNGANNTQ